MIRALLIAWALLFFVVPARAAEMSASDATALLCPGRGHLAPLFAAAAERWKVRPVVLVAMARVESTCDPTAVNRRTGAVGLMQIMPGASADVDHIGDANELMDPATNIELGARHLRRWWTACGSLAGGLAVFHGRQKCSQHRGDRYVARVLGFVGWATRQLAKLQARRS